MARKKLYLIEDVSDIIPFDREAIVRPYFATSFEEELDSWDRRESTWPAQRAFAVFLEWFEVDVHSMVLDLTGKRLLRTENYP